MSVSAAALKGQLCGEILGCIPEAQPSSDFGALFLLLKGPLLAQTLLEESVLPEAKNLVKTVAEV